MKKPINIILIYFLFNGCAGILKTENLTKYNQSTKLPISVACISEIKIFFNDVTFGKFNSEVYSADKNSMYQENYKLINKLVTEKTGNNTQCQGIYKLKVELSNIPENESRGLALLNIVSFGIIPYWDRFYNELKLTFSDSTENNIIYSSRTNYLRIHSIFLWPVMPFYIDGTIELDLKTLPYHFNNLQKQDDVNQN